LFAKIFTPGFTLTIHGPAFYDIAL